MLNEKIAGPALAANTAPKPRPWPLTYQIIVNGIILDRQLRPAGSGRLMSDGELDEMEHAYYTGEPAESFVARVITGQPAEMAVLA